MSVLCCHGPNLLITLALRQTPDLAGQPLALLGPDERVWAVGLLKLVRILGDQVRSADSFLIEDVEECAEAIERAVRAVEQRCMQY